MFFWAVHHGMAHHALGSSFNGTAVAAPRRQRTRAAAGCCAPPTECAASRASKSLVLDRLATKLGPETMFIGGVNFKGFTARGAAARLLLRQPRLARVSRQT